MPEEYLLIELESDKLPFNFLATKESNYVSLTIINPEAEEYTWSNKSFKIQCRLDLFLISKKLNALTENCKIIYAPETDHSATLIHVKSDELRHKK